MALSSGKASPEIQKYGLQINTGRVTFRMDTWPRQQALRTVNRRIFQTAPLACATQQHVPRTGNKKCQLIFI